tara:strand:- start:133 stop:600 length:468 start_codon:yes stop_codon:yes gene_type:complete
VEQATEDWHLTRRVSQPRQSSGKGWADVSCSRASRAVQDALPSRSKAQASCSPPNGDKQRSAEQESLAQQEHTAAAAAATAAPSAWLRVASDDPDLAFHEIFRYGDDDERVPGSACTKDMKDSKRLLVLTCIEGGQHKQPPLFKRRHSTACNLTC